MESDEQLIEAINRGERGAFESLYYRYRDWVYNIAWRFTGNQQDALDVLQDTFIYLMGKFPGFTLTASMKTFLYPTVKHLAMNVRRKKRKFTSDEDCLCELPAPEIKEGDSRSELAVVLKVLPDEQREILLLRFVDDMELLEISAALNIPIGTVKSRLHRALQTLREDSRTREYFFK
jgi:RNA polymerase sigma-70 factor (ECF subfamily)